LLEITNIIEVSKILKSQIILAYA